MFFYVSFGKKFALFIEGSAAYGCKPFLSIYGCNGEYIIDMPYVQVIVTPYAVLKHEQVCSEGVQTKGQGHDRRQKYREFRQASSGVTGG